MNTFEKQPQEPPHPSIAAEDDFVLRIKGVQKLSGLGRTATYGMVSRPDFPEAIPLTKSARGWWRSEVLAYLNALRKPQGTPHQNALTISKGDCESPLMQGKRAGCSYEDILAAADSSPRAFTSPPPTTAAQNKLAECTHAQERALHPRRHGACQAHDQGWNE